MNLSRSNVEESEMLIAEYLDAGDVPIRRSSEVEGLIACELDQYIENSVVGAEHIGNSYDSIGDILIYTESGRRYYELKMSEKSGRSGTLFNTSSDLLVSHGLFEDSPMTWREFMGENDHSEFVMDSLYSFEFYPEEFGAEFNTELQTRKGMGRYIRDLVKESDFSCDELVSDNVNASEKLVQAAEVKSDIEEFDREVKLNYLGYLKDFEVNEEVVKALSLVLAAGYHRKQQIEEYLDVVLEVSENVGGVSHVFDDYRIVYANIDEDGSVSTQLSKQSQLVDHLSEVEFDIQIGDNDGEIEQTSLMVGFVDDDEFTPLYRCSLHWGNVFQGIATPSWRGFECPYMKEF